MEGHIVMVLPELPPDRMLCEIAAACDGEGKNIW